MNLPPRQPKPPTPPQPKPNPVPQSILFNIQVHPITRLGVPVSAMAEIEKREAISGTSWSSFEILLEEFFLKVGNGDRVYAIFRLSSLPGHDHILKNFVFRGEGTLKIGIQLRQLIHLLKKNALANDVITLFQITGNNHLTLFIGSSPSPHTLPIQQLNENFDTGFDMRLLDPVLRVTIEASLMMNGIRKLLFDSHDEQPDGECLIEMTRAVERYTATVRGMNRKALLEVCSLKDKAHLEVYRYPERLITNKPYRVSDAFIALRLRIEPSDDSSSSSGDYFFGNPFLANIGGITFVYYPDTFNIEPALQVLEPASQDPEQQVFEVTNIADD